MNALVVVSGEYSGKEVEAVFTEDKRKECEEFVRRINEQHYARNRHHPNWAQIIEIPMNDATYITNILHHSLWDVPVISMQNHNVSEHKDPIHIHKSVSDQSIFDYYGPLMVHNFTLESVPDDYTAPILVDMTSYDFDAEELSKVPYSVGTIEKHIEFSDGTKKYIRLEMIRVDAKTAEEARKIAYDKFAEIISREEGVNV